MFSFVMKTISNLVYIKMDLVGFLRRKLQNLFILGLNWEGHENMNTKN